MQRRGSVHLCTVVDRFITIEEIIGNLFANSIRITKHVFNGLALI